MVGADVGRTSACEGRVIGPVTLDDGIVLAVIDTWEGDVIGPLTGVRGATMIGEFVVGAGTLGAVMADTTGAGGSGYGSIGCMTPDGPRVIEDAAGYEPA